MNNLAVKLLILFYFTLVSVAFSQSGQKNVSYDAYKNFDFIPGEKILFFDDFSKGLSLWNVLEWDVEEDSHKGRVTSLEKLAGHWYFMPRKGTSQPKGLKTLPDQFTLEYDFFVNDQVSEHEGGILHVMVKGKNLDINQYSYHFDDSPQIQIDIKPSNDLLYLSAWREYGYADGIDEGRKIFEDLKENYWKPNQLYRISISRNGAHVKVYVNEDKVMDLPNALPLNGDYTLLLCNNLWIEGYFITNVRIATGIPQPALEFKDNNPYVTQNILFDVNSDKIKPGSYPVMKKIAAAIKELEGQVLIVGHTDSDGDEAKNMELSKKRAAAVKNMLVKEFGIDAAKLQTDGKGQTEPVDSNETPQGKANNRRVAFEILK